MNKKSKSSIAEIINLLQAKPKQAYENLIASHYYFNNEKSDEFWKEFDKLDLSALIKRVPESSNYFKKFTNLKLFYTLRLEIDKEVKKAVEIINVLNPTKRIFVQTLYLCLDLGSTQKFTDTLPKYSDKTLKAINKITSLEWSSLSDQGNSAYSIELLNITGQLIKYQSDVILLSEFVDNFVWANFELTENEENGYILQPSQTESKRNNTFILNHLKRQAQFNFKKCEAQSKLSKEKTFISVDSRLKTDQGFATIIHNQNCIITEQQEGTTSLQVDNSIFDELNSQDPAIKNEANIKLYNKLFEQHFFSYFRNALAGIYHPNDEINLHQMAIWIKNGISTSLYEILSASSCLIAKAHVLNNIANISNSSIEYYANILWNEFNFRFPNKSKKAFENHITAEVIQYLNTNESLYNKLMFFNREEILKWFREIEELKNKTKNELNTILELFTNSKDSRFSINLLNEVGNEYYLPYKSFSIVNINQMLYENYISNKLFNNQQSGVGNFIHTYTDIRECQFTDSIKRLFKKITNYTEDRVSFHFGKDLQGETDVIAYFEKENIVVAIQAKLSNVSPRTEMKKSEWIEKRIFDEAYRQIKKDKRLLGKDEGLKLVAEKIGYQSAIVAPTVYSIIVTDNYFVDHKRFEIIENEEYFTSISFFELESLILNRKIDDAQPDFNLDNRYKAAKNLIEDIESNRFWEFLSEKVDKFNYSTKLSTIPPEKNIEMKI